MQHRRIRCENNEMDSKEQKTPERERAREREETREHLKGLNSTGNKKFI